MAYCNKCGAYIPDGHTVCLACGNDTEEKEAQAEAAQAQTAQEQSVHEQTAQEQTAQHAYDDSANYYSFSNDELRRKLEEQRKKQQEQSRKWAEQEKQRRERERESVKDNWKTYTNSSSSSYSAPSYRARNTSSAGWNNTRLLSVLSYISGLFLIPLIFKPEDRKAGFHAKQGLRLFIFGLLCDAVTRISGFGILLSLSRLFLMIKGIINAINDREEPLPFIGTFGEKKN